MRPAPHASLVNGRSGDPAVFVEFPLSGRALLLDLGELHRLPVAALLRVDAALVTHAHVDHLIGFDTLLRHLVGREKHLPILGPTGLAERIGHKLLGYGWDLAGLYEAPLTFEVIELAPDNTRRRTRFRLGTGFRPEPLGVEGPPNDAAPDGTARNGTGPDEAGPDTTVRHGTGPSAAAPASAAQVPAVALRLPGLTIRAATLEHHGAPCLGYRVEEDATVNVSRAPIEAAGLRPGPWINALKQAILDGQPDTHPIPLTGPAQPRSGRPRSAEPRPAQPRSAQPRSATTHSAQLGPNEARAPGTLPTAPFPPEILPATVLSAATPPAATPPAATLPAATLPLGTLRPLATLRPGFRLAYGTDLADTASNRAAMVALARDADLLFLESAFAAADSDIAARRGHLCTRATGEIARAAGAQRLEPFHFSARYRGEDARMLAEVSAAFGRPVGSPGGNARGNPGGNPAAAPEAPETGTPPARPAENPPGWLATPAPGR